MPLKLANAYPKQHILYTLSAVQIAATYDAVAELDSEAIVKYVCGLQSAEDGSFMGDKWGEVDTRFSFCAVATLKLLGRLDACDVDKAVEFLESCKNFDGGFGSKPGSESHAGLIYCAVGFLSVTERLDVLDPDLLGWWLCERQLPSGGLNGRPEKLPGKYEKQNSAFGFRLSALCKVICNTSPLISTIAGPSQFSESWVLPKLSRDRLKRNRMRSKMFVLLIVNLSILKFFSATNGMLTILFQS